jgi:hypothetical protein
MMSALRRMGCVPGAAFSGGFYFNRIRRVHVQAPGAAGYSVAGARRITRAHPAAVLEVLRGRGQTTRLAVEVVRLRGWLAVTEEEKCDK